ncbi:hypothetical protein C8255_16560 [filamentous cyanobacterium CCP3]|nr:hypothetical protein C8255_16560 [filamentous cyanobacterium CCP3]
MGLRRARGRGAPGAGTEFGLAAAARAAGGPLASLLCARTSRGRAKVAGIQPDTVPYLTMVNRRKWLDVGRYLTVRRLGLAVIAALLSLVILAPGSRPLLTWADTGEADPSEPAAAPVWVEADAGTSWKIFGLEIVGKIMSAQTDGAYSVVISTTPPEGGPPLHVHEHEDELFYIIQGTYEFRFGDETILASAGDLVHLPAHIPHKFRNVGSEPGMAMNTMTPGGFERFFVEIDQLPKGQPLDRSQVAAIASRYGLQFLPESPSPER